MLKNISFYRSTLLTYVYLNNDNVKDITRMFMLCDNLKILNIKNFSAKGRVKIDGIFYGCMKLTKLECEDKRIFDEFNKLEKSKEKK